MTDNADMVERRWKKGDLVQKKRGSAWRGRVVGYYETDHTAEGYNVESLFEPGSAQLWPLAALDDWDGTGTPEQLLAHIQTLTRELAEAREALGIADRLFAQALKLPPDEQHLWLFGEEGIDAWQKIRAATHGFQHELSSESRKTLGGSHEA